MVWKRNSPPSSLLRPVYFLLVYLSVLRGRGRGWGWGDKTIRLSQENMDPFLSFLRSLFSIFAQRFSTIFLEIFASRDTVPEKKNGFFFSISVIWRRIIIGYLADNCKMLSFLFIVG